MSEILHPLRLKYVAVHFDQAYHLKLKIPDLHQLHEDWLVHRTKITPKAPVTIIDANGDYKDLSPQYLKYQVEILQHGKTN